MKARQYTTRAVTSTRFFCLIALLALAIASGTTPVGAHEIPADVTVRAFVKPESDLLRVLVRVPLEALRDVIIPLRGDVFLELPQAEEAARVGADLWIAGGTQAFEGETDLGRPRLAAVRLTLPGDGAFVSWEQALAHLSAPPIDPADNVVWTQAQVDVLLEFPITNADAHFALETEFALLGLRTQSVIQFLTVDGPPRVFQFIGDAGRLHLDPRWHQAARRFVVSGIEHILIGTDHLLFLLCLVVPFRRVRSLVLIVTAFTVAHSITLVAAASGWVPQGLWFPPFIETLIAASIVWMAFENIVGATSVRRRWVLTAMFGLVHGFGFAFVLGDSLQFGGRHTATSLAAFNIGVELGQLLVLAVALPCLWALFRYVVPERIGGILISAVVAHQAWHWMMERSTDLMAHDAPWPATFGWVWLLRGVIVLWIAGGVIWWLRTKAAHRS